MVDASFENWKAVEVYELAGSRGLWEQSRGEFVPWCANSFRAGHLRANKM